MESLFRRSDQDDAEVSSEVKRGRRLTAYVDTFSLYYKNGELNPQYSKDGIHIRDDAYEVWANAIRKHIDF